MCDKNTISKRPTRQCYKNGYLLRKLLPKGLFCLILAMLWAKLVSVSSATLVRW